MDNLTADFDNYEAFEESYQSTKDPMNGDGENDSSETPKRRQSLSQPDLRAKVEKIPILATLEENKQLQRENFVLNSKLKDAAYRERELRDQLPREVNAIMDEFFALQLGKQDLERKYSELSAIQQRAELADMEAMKAKELADLADREYQRIVCENSNLREELDKFRTKVNELEEVNNYGNDDWTLASSSGDRVLEEVTEELDRFKQKCAILSEKNENLEKEISQLKDKFNRRDTDSITDSAENLQKKILELEEESQKKEEQYSAVLKKYMEKVTKLERTLTKAGASFDITPNLTFSTSDKEKFEKCLKSLMQELTTARAQNQELRKQCTALSGGVLDVSTLCDNEFLKQKLVDLSQNVVSNDEIAITDAEANMRQVVEDCEEIFQKLEREGLLNLTSSQPSDATSSGPLMRSVSSEVDVEEDNVDLELQDADKSVNEFNKTSGNMMEMAVMNQSINNVLYHSFSTSADIGDAKVKLASLRNLINNMFNRLKGSAALFEEIIEYLSDGNDANKELAEKINKMSLNWTRVCQDADEVTAVVDVAELSVTNLQHQLSILEHSLNETSFLLDVNRRTTINKTGIDLNISKNLHISLLENQNLTSAHNELVSLRAKYDDAVKTVESLNDLANLLKEDKENLASSLALANSNVEIVRKHLSEVELANSNLQLEKDEFSARCNEYGQEIKNTLQQLQTAQEESDIMRERLGSLEHHVALITDELLKSKEIEDELRKELSLATHEKELLEQNMVNLAEEIKKKNHVLEANNKLKEDYSHIKVQADQASLELNKAKSALHNFEKDMEKQRRYFEGQIRAQAEIAQAARENANDLAQKLLEQEKSGLDNHSKFGLMLDEHGRFSMVEKSDQKDRAIQTDNDELIAEYYQLYARLAQCVRRHLLLGERGYTFSNEDGLASINDDYLEIEDKLSAYCEQHEELVDLLAKNNDKLTELGEIANKMEYNSSHGASMDKYQKTEIEVGRRVSPMRQLFYALTVKSVDLVQNVKLLQKHLDSSKLGELASKILDDSRNLRNELNDHYACFGSKDKENEGNIKSPEELLQKLEITERVGAVLFAGLKRANEKLVELEKAVPKSNSAVIQKISKELEEIAKVMDSAQMSSKHLPHPRKSANLLKKSTT